MRSAVVGLMLLAIVPVASANLVVNGDFSAGETGWTQWNSPWGSGFSWDASSGVGTLSTGTGSFGWAQAITTVSGQAYTITADWGGDGDAAWSEILFFNDDGRSVYDQADAPHDSSILYKIDGWGMNGGYPFDFGPANASQYYAPGPNTNTILATGTTMYVVLKNGSGGAGVTTMFDNIVVTPEPASLVLLGLAVPFLRRRRG